MPSNEFKELTLEEIKAKIGSQPKVIPETVLDYAAMHAAIDRFQLERKQTELREWLVYEAPPGVYDMYIEERKRLQQQHEEQLRISNKFTGIVIICVVSYLLYTLYAITHMGYPR